MRDVDLDASLRMGEERQNSDGVLQRLVTTVNRRSGVNFVGKDRFDILRPCVAAGDSRSSNERAERQRTVMCYLFVACVTRDLKPTFSPPLRNSK